MIIISIVKYQPLAIMKVIVTIKLFFEMDWNCRKNDLRSNHNKTKKAVSSQGCAKDFFMTEAFRNQESGCPLLETGK